MLTGDADCDGGVDSVDAFHALRFVAGLGEPDCLAAADVDCSGVVDSVDALKILRFVAGLPRTGLPPGCEGIVGPAAPAATGGSRGTAGGLRAAWFGALLAVPALVMATRRRRT